MNLEVMHARPPGTRPGLEPVFRRLGQFAPLSTEDRELIAGLIGPAEVMSSGRDLVAEAAPSVRAGVIVSGWACRQRLLADGRRQIYAFLLPGDAIGVTERTGPLTTSWTVCLTKVGYADAGPLRRLIVEAPEQHPAITRGLRAMAAQHEARLLDHIVRLGRHTAYERVAHLLLELHDRLQVVGMADGAAFPMPLTQETLADALGLSVVHVNRVLQQLKRERLIELHAGRCTLLEPALLAQICDYARPAARR